MKTKLITYPLNIVDKIIDRFEEEVQERLKRVKHLLWSDFEQYFIYEDQLKIFGFLVFLLSLGLVSFIFLTFNLAIFAFFLVLIFEYLTYKSIRNFIKREGRIKKIQKDIWKLRNHY